MCRLFVSKNSLLHKALFFLGAGQLNASATLRVQNSHTCWGCVDTNGVKENQQQRELLVLLISRRDVQQPAVWFLLRKSKAVNRWRCSPNFPHPEQLKHWEAAASDAFVKIQT